MILVGDCIQSMRGLPAASIQTCVTSPPYFGLRDYGHDGQIGLEPTPDEFVAKLVEVFREVRRVLRDDGTLWLNIGDSYARGFGGGSPGKKAATNQGAFCGRKPGKKPPGLSGKDLIGIPWRVALALQGDGWVLRQDIIWSKPNAMPESVLDRCTKSHEYLFLFAKSGRYLFNKDAMSEVGASGEIRKKRSVWAVNNTPYKGAHFATFPPSLIEPCVLAGSNAGDVVLDPFGGSGTTGMVANQHGRKFVLCELNPAYADIAKDRIGEESTEADRQQRMFA